MELSSLDMEFLQASQQAIAAQQAQELARQVELKQAQVEAQLQAVKVRRLRRVAIGSWPGASDPDACGNRHAATAESPWQPLENFPRPGVSAGGGLERRGRRPCHDEICAGTSNIGIGCTQEGRRGTSTNKICPPAIQPIPAAANSRHGRGVQAMSIDPANPRHIAASFWDGKMYLSDNGGVLWHVSGEGLPANPDFVRSVAIYGDLALAIVGSELYGSQDGGDHWMPMGRYSQPFWGEVHDIHIDAGSARAYAATDNGLYATSLQSPWGWQQMVQLPSVRHIAQPTPGDGELLLAALGPSNQSTLYRWTAEQSLQSLTSFPRQVLSLAVTANPADRAAFYVLLDSGEVVAVSDLGVKHSLGRRPGWPWDQAFDLMAVPAASGDGSLLLLGHTDGLLRFTAPANFP